MGFGPFGYELWPIGGSRTNLQIFFLQTIHLKQKIQKKKEFNTFRYLQILLLMQHTPKNLTGFGTIIDASFFGFCRRNMESKQKIGHYVDMCQTVKTVNIWQRLTEPSPFLQLWSDTGNQP